MDNAGLIDAKFQFAGFDFPHRLTDVDGHRAGLGIGHEAARTQNLTDAADGRHHIRCCHRLVKIEPTFVDLLDQLVAADEIGPCLLCFLFLFPFGEGENPNGFTHAVRQIHRAANILIRLPRIHSKPDRHFHGFVEFRARRVLHQAQAVLQGIALSAVDFGQRGAIVFPISTHVFPLH